MSSIDFSHALFVLAFASVWYMVNVLKQQLLQEIKARDEKFNTMITELGTKLISEFSTRDETLNDTLTAFDTKLASELSARDATHAGETQKLSKDLTTAISRIETEISTTNQSIER